MDPETYFKGFYDCLVRKYSECIHDKEEPIPNTKEYYLQKLILRRNDVVIVVRIDSPRRLQIGSHQYIELSKGQTCLIFKKSWRKEMAIRFRDFAELEDLMYQLQSKYILNIHEHFFVKGDDYEAFFLDEGLEKIDPELLAERVFESQLKSAELSERNYQEKRDMNFEKIGFLESLTVEFKEQFPEKAIDVAKGLIAFANTKGGKIYFGVDDDGFIVGVENPVDLQQRICGVARNSCEPELNPSFEIEKHNQKEVLIVRTDESKYVHRRNDGKFYTRIGANSVEMSVDELEELIGKRRKARLQ
jgi:hypothetical protein